MWSLARPAALVLLLSSTAAHATGPVYNVNTVADVPDAAIDGICDTGGICDGVPCCTLRAAVMEANHGPNPLAEEVTINLPAGLYTFTRSVGIPDDDSNGDLNLTGKIRIVGVGFDLSIIEANHLDRAIAVASSAVVTLSDLRVQGGQPPNAPSRVGGGNGGGILNTGQPTLLRCLVRKNQTISHEGDGGGIASSYPGSLTLVDSVVRVNGTDPSGRGGGIASYNTTSISRSTVNSNGASKGGGIFQLTGSLQIVNSTISQNVATDRGGGLYLLDSVESQLNNVTVATNTAGGTSPAGSDAYLSSSSAVISNSILASGDLGCASSTVTSNGYNFFINALPIPGVCGVTGFYIASLNLPLGALADYGGSTFTHSLVAGSVAIDAGNPPAAGNPYGCYDALGAPLTTDQRGVKRAIGVRCDLGAFEMEPIGDANGDGYVDVSDVFYLINFLFAGGPIPLGRANVNGDASLDISDVFYLVNFLFAGGPPPG
jgi:hypothetical protein